ncbi:hypothetical protein H6G00_05940 [Leptolyngbya sp. FACHB-541]|uniref:hypothetical protein n=1 Tax=Leptolyngbya sp. FACHB-541 TaxID=2692810 RepID=UPI001687E83A|nr:hypothetical protein [Leptolyngbya sp. FACHB-541]MBD1996159.1 hypothetical protein [Leptolyngbya sp. FACHB-541]
MNIDPNFWIGCVGAAAPEALRLYNLRSQPVFRWSWGYLIFSIPFLIVGGFIAWVLEPSTRWAAFYSGLTAPVLLTTVLKDTAKAQKELEEVEKERDQIQREREELQASNQEFKQTIEELKQKLERSQQETTLPSERIPPVPLPPSVSPSIPPLPSQIPTEPVPLISPQAPQRSPRKPSASFSFAVSILIGFLSVLFIRPFILNEQNSSYSTAEQPQPDWQPIILIVVLGAAIALFLYLRRNRWFKEFLKGI